MTNSNVLKYRNIWVIFGVIWVMLYHSGVEVSGILEDFKTIGQGGVDISLFASGVGCYYSFCKCRDYEAFIIRRIKRIMPSWIVFVSVWLGYKIWEGEVTFSNILGNLLGYQSLTGKGGEFSWYISAIMLFYFFTPYLFIITEKITSIIKAILVISLIIVISFSFWDTPFLIIVTRVPIYFIGMLYAKQTMKKDKLKKSQVLLLAFMFLAGLGILFVSNKFSSADLWKIGLVWYPFILVAPGACILISALCVMANRYKLGKVIIDFLAKAADYSFELFLVHVLIFDVYRQLISIGVLNNYLWCWVWLIIPIALGSVFLKKVSLRILEVFYERKMD